MSSSESGFDPKLENIIHLMEQFQQVPSIIT